MKIYETVKTEKKARKMINDYITDNHLAKGYFENSSVRCECGETQAITWYNGNILITAGICHICGNDNAFTKDILNVR